MLLVRHILKDLNLVRNYKFDSISLRVCIVVFKAIGEL